MATAAAGLALTSRRVPDLQAKAGIYRRTMQQFDWDPLSEVQRRDPRWRSRWGFASPRLLAAGVTLFGVSLVAFILFRIGVERG
jgi:hypothetical protein